MIKEVEIIKGQLECAVRAMAYKDLLEHLKRNAVGAEEDKLSFENLISGSFDDTRINVPNTLLCKNNLQAMLNLKYEFEISTCYNKYVQEAKEAFISHIENTVDFSLEKAFEVLKSVVHMAYIDFEIS